MLADRLWYKNKYVEEDGGSDRLIHVFQKNRPGSRKRGRGETEKIGKDQELGWVPDVDDENDADV